MKLSTIMCPLCAYGRIVVVEAAQNNEHIISASEEEIVMAIVNDRLYEYPITAVSFWNAPYYQSLLRHSACHSVRSLF